MRTIIPAIRLAFVSKALNCCLLLTSLVTLSGCKRRMGEDKKPWPALEIPVKESISLHSAVLQEDIAAIKKLLSTGSDINATDGQGNTPLHLAAREGHVGAVRCLLEKGASVEAKGNGGERPLHSAAENGHTAVVQLLLDCEADVNAMDRATYTPLHCAAEKGYISSYAAPIRTRG
jgi:ankyrin repeat protein